MLFGRRRFSRKARIFLALGNLCMFAGLVLSRFNSSVGAQHVNMNHFLCGFLLGIAITFLFAALYQARSDQRDSSPTC